MDEADDDYHGPPLPGGQRQIPGSSQRRQQISYSSFNPSGQSQRQSQPFQMALQMEREMEREMYIRQQLELQRNIQLRRQLFQEQHQQFISELEGQHHIQHLQQDPLLQQQGLMELQQQLRSPGRGAYNIQEEQLLLQQQRQRLLQQQQQQQHIHEQRRMQRDATAPDQNLPSPSRSGPPAQRRSVQLGEDRPEQHEHNQEPTSKLSVEREPTRVEPQDQPPKGPDAEGKDVASERPLLKKSEDARPKSIAKGAEVVAKKSKKEKRLPSEESRKRKDSDGSALARTARTEKRVKANEEIGKSRVEEKPKKQISDIALLLKATEDPAVKKVVMKCSTSEPDLESKDVNIESDGKSEKEKDPTSTFSKKSSDLESLALEALRRDFKPVPKQKEARSPHGHLEALIKTLQNITPPPTPPPQEDKKDGCYVSPLDTHKFSVPLLPVEPSYAGPDSPKKRKSALDITKLDGASEKSKDTGYPTYSELMAGSKKANAKIPGFEERDVKEPVMLPDPDESSNKPAVYTIPIDTWWPSNSVVNRERKLQGYKTEEEDSDKEDDGSTVITESAREALRQRLRNNVEPGVLQKLPHCKLHRIRAKQRREQCPIPLFCFQVTESHCTDMMVCCSVCSTWRHVTCGGHYTHNFPVQSNSCPPFVPVCDICHEEANFVSEHPKAQKRIERQRTEHLRRALATTSVIRQASLAKHGGTYKWPLGSVTTTHIGGHTRSVHSRHERAEKQWSETASKLGNGLGYRPKERAKVRTREFERILTYLEDAEGQTDRHNMMLFLQRDTEREHPVGFEAPRRNFFDPDEDPDSDHEYDGEDGDTSEGCSDGDGAANGMGDDDAVIDKAALKPSIDNESDSMSVDHEPKRKDIAGRKEGDSMSGGTMPKATLKNDIDVSSVVTAESQTNVVDKGEDEVASSNEDRNDTSSSSSDVCARVGCSNRPRYDSMFCSDSCGISTVERDLLNAFEYASEIHSSIFRP